MMQTLFALLKAGEIHWLDCCKAPYQKPLLDILILRGLVNLERDTERKDWYYRPSAKAYQQFPFMAPPKSGWRKA